MSISANKKRALLRKFRSRPAAAEGPRAHIIPTFEGWAVKKEGVKRASAIKDTKEEAVQYARGLSVLEIIIHEKDGTFNKVFLDQANE